MSDQQKHPIVIKKCSSELEVNVEVGTPFTIELESNPTTGFVWEIETHEKMTVLSTDFILHESSAVGVGGLFKINLVVNESTQFRLKVRLRRPWESTDSYVDNFEVNIKSQKRI